MRASRTSNEPARPPGQGVDGLPRGRVQIRCPGVRTLAHTNVASSLRSASSTSRRRGCEPCGDPFRRPHGSSRSGPSPRTRCRLCASVDGGCSVSLMHGRSSVIGAPAWRPANARHPAAGWMWGPAPRGGNSTFSLCHRSRASCKICPTIEPGSPTSFALARIASRSTSNES